MFIPVACPLQPVVTPETWYPVRHGTLFFRGKSCALRGCFLKMRMPLSRLSYPPVQNPHQNSIPRVKKKVAQEELLWEKICKGSLYILRNDSDFLLLGRLGSTGRPMVSLLTRSALQWMPR